MKKQGIKSNGTDSAHILSWGLVNSIETHTAGRPKNEGTRSKVTKELNSDKNLRIKSEYGNRILDERRDSRIAASYASNTAIKGKTTTKRASQAYESAKKMGNSLDGITKALGSIKIYDDDTKRTHLLKNHEKHLNK
jgi:hypothetical protein